MGDMTLRGLFPLVYGTYLVTGYTTSIYGS